MDGDIGTVSIGDDQAIILRETEIDVANCDAVKWEDLGITILTGDSSQECRIERRGGLARKDGMDKPYSLNWEKINEEEGYKLLEQIREANMEVYSKRFMGKVSKIGGITIKVLQVLAMREDLIPSKRIRNVFEKAQDSNSARDSVAVIAKLKEEYTTEQYDDFVERFGDNVGEAVNSGSIGQTHKLTDKDGNKYILKVTFSDDVKDKWTSQWNIMSILGSSKTINELHSCWTTIASMKDNIFGEMNFIREMRFTNYAKNIINRDSSQKDVMKGMKLLGWKDNFLNAKVVNIVTELSTTSIFVQESGGETNLKKWLKIPGIPDEWKKDVIRSLVCWWGYILFKHKIVFSDVHGGNFIIQHNDGDYKPTGIVYIDWGQTLILDDEFIIDGENENINGISKDEWFIEFKKLYRDMSLIYSDKEKMFKDHLYRKIENIKQGFKTKSPFFEMIGKMLFHNYQHFYDTKFKEQFISDVGSVMMSLGFETTYNDPKILVGLALSAFNDDPKTSGAEQSMELIKSDPIKKFPAYSTLPLRGLTNIAGMLKELTKIVPDIVGKKNVVQIWEPFYSDWITKPL